MAILFRWPAAPSVSTPKEMDRVIGAAFWVLARARVRLSQIRPEGIRKQCSWSPSQYGSMSRRNASPLSPRGRGERTLGHDRSLAWPVPFALLTGIDQSARRNRRFLPNTGGVLSTQTQTE